MIYLDSSAVVKLVREEVHSRDLIDWLERKQSESLVSSALVEVEVARALWRYAPECLSVLPDVLAQLYRVDLDAHVRTMAAAYRFPGLRSLDAIHLATAETVGGASKSVQAFVVYDRRLGVLAAERGFCVESPGLS
jgi:predicted nucleic acid-binding protein